MPDWSPAEWSIWLSVHFPESRGHCHPANTRMHMLCHDFLNYQVCIGMCYITCCWIRYKSLKPTFKNIIQPLMNSKLTDLLQRPTPFEWNEPMCWWELFLCSAPFLQQPEPDQEIIPSGDVFVFPHVSAIISLKARSSGRYPVEKLWVLYCCEHQYNFS